MCYLNLPDEDCDDDLSDEYFPDEYFPDLAQFLAWFCDFTLSSSNIL